MLVTDMITNASDRLSAEISTLGRNFSACQITAARSFGGIAMPPSSMAERR